MSIVFDDITRFFGGAIGVDSLLIDFSRKEFALRFVISVCTFFFLWFNLKNNNSCTFQLWFFLVGLLFYVSWGVSIIRMQSALSVIFTCLYAISLTNIFF